MSMTDYILSHQNRAYSELYIIRGDVYKKQGNLEAAKQEYLTFSCLTNGITFLNIQNI